VEIGIGLHSAIAGADGQTLLDWARRAEARGFSTAPYSGAPSS
jgi:hypothetical protein